MGTHTQKKEINVSRILIVVLHPVSHLYAFKRQLFQMFMEKHIHKASLCLLCPRAEIRLRQSAPYITTGAERPNRYMSLNPAMDQSTQMESSNSDKWPSSAFVPADTSYIQIVRYFINS